MMLSQSVCILTTLRGGDYLLQWGAFVSSIRFASLLRVMRTNWPPIGTAKQCNGTGWR